MASPPGAGAWDRRAMLVLFLVPFPTYASGAFNSALSYWDGGYSTGPRRLTPALGFARLPLAFLWPGTGRGLRRLMTAGLSLSFVVSLVCAAVSMTTVALQASRPWSSSGSLASSG
jgi:hypothetical protein